MTEHKNSNYTLESHSSNPDTNTQICQNKNKQKQTKSSRQDQNKRQTGKTNPQTKTKTNAQTNQNKPPPVFPMHIGLFPFDPSFLPSPIRLFRPPHRTFPSRPNRGVFIYAREHAYARSCRSPRHPELPSPSADRCRQHCSRWRLQR